MALTLKSNAFQNEGIIPSRYTCDGDDISPQLAWDDIPVGTQSFALICDDPDAPVGTWDHWILFNIPATTKEFPENMQNLPAGTQQGKNSWDKTGYGGPCPPDKMHRYFFRLYALDTVLEISPGSTKGEVLLALKGHTLAEAELMGQYDRNK